MMEKVSQTQPVKLPPLLFVLGKGGVGRSTVAVSLAQLFASRGKKSLIVQWSLEDSISRWFQKPQAGHSAQEVARNIFVMNFEADEAIREYFVEHLKMKVIYKLVIENKHVQRLIQAAPGLHELFFLGRLFWLIELSMKEKGWAYDHVIVDSPATGHSTSLFQIAETMASFGFTGPLAYECERVAKLLADPQKTGTVVVTLPEELPTEEVLEFVPKLSAEMKRPPLAVLVNRSVSREFRDVKEDELMSKLSQSGLKQNFVDAIDLVAGELFKKLEFERLLNDKLTPQTSLGCFALSEELLTDPFISDAAVTSNLAAQLAHVFGNRT